MSLTSSSTLTDAINQLKDNLLWEGDSTKARNALEAIRFILLERPESISVGGRSFSRASLEDLEKKLCAYVSKVGSTSSRAPFCRARALM